ncbi:Wzz/FepE/Etk N-terminal domain-containing protein [Gammaproteobacteria bacterium]|nr:Wzz/FepE/Etk N-terminal domain-containing protein [Gammaproteobacteria bacterium]
MQETYTNKRPNDFDEVIDLKELFYILLEGKRIIVSVTAFVSIVGVIYSLLLPNIYESKALLFPVNTSNSIAGALGSYGSFSGLTGISLPSVEGEGNSLKATEKMGTLSFFENNIFSNIYLPDLMAVKAWNAKTNSLVYDKDVYDVESNAWVRDVSYPKQTIPSAQESYEIFKEDHLSFSVDKKSGFITLAVKHQSPFIAKEWTELIINEVNDFYRTKDKLESEKAVSYLNQQISLTSLSEIKEALALLLQEQVKKLTLIEASELYVFDYIDPPAVMEKKSEPRRSLICIMAAILGCMLSVLYVLLRNYALNEKTL